MRKVKVIIFIAAVIIGLTFAKVFGAVLGFSLPTINFSAFSGIAGSGTAKVEKRDVRDFRKVDVGGIIDVEITAQKDFSVDVEADDNLLEYVETEMQGDTLKIYTKKRISPRTKIRVIIAMPDLTGVDVSGVSRLNASNIKTDSFKLGVSGASRIEISGEAQDLNIEGSGASRINAEKFKVANANVDISGATRVSVFATEEVKVDASGASKVSYLGEPKNVVKSTSGASKVSQK